MDSQLVIYSALMLFGALVSSVSQAMLKYSARKQHDSRAKEYLNPVVILAYALFFATTLICVFAYRVVPLSLGPVLESSSYVYVTILGVVLFHEKITPKKAIALVLIIVGIAISSFSQ